MRIIRSLESHNDARLLNKVVNTMLSCKSQDYAGTVLVNDWYSTVYHIQMFGVRTNRNLCETDALGRPTGRGELANSVPVIYHPDVPTPYIGIGSEQNTCGLPASPLQVNCDSSTNTCPFNRARGPFLGKSGKKCYGQWRR